MTPLVFVWLGNCFPTWGRTALSLSTSYSGSKTILITNRAAGPITEAIEQYFVEDFYKAPSNWKQANQTLDQNFRDGFWLKTTERFFVLEQFMETYNFKSLFHAELDNWVFNIAGLDSRLNNFGSGFFCPRDSLKRGIASLIYVNHSDSLNQLNRLALDNSLVEKNDMTLLGHLLETSNQFFSLSTEIVFQDLDSFSWERVSAEVSHGIFDAAAIGQFLFGIDPRNGSIFLTNGFENENKGCNLWQLQYRLKRKNKTFELINPETGQSVNLFNIHVHSKLFRQVANESRLLRILDRVNQGKKTLMNIDPMQNRIVRGIRSRIFA